MKHLKKLAVVCPGQGSQSSGMLGDWAQKSALVEHTFAEASSALGFDLWALVQEGGSEALNLTENTQPALLAASVALWRVLQERIAFAPSYLAGHSLGEYSALVIADALSLEDAVRVVRARGRFMSEAMAPGKGGMLAVLGLEVAVLQDLCAKVCSEQAGIVEVANINAPGQVVLAGDSEALSAAVQRCLAQGAKRAITLPVSGPFHSCLMQEASDRLSEILDAVKIEVPKVPVVQNVSQEPEVEPERIRRHLKLQVTTPVNWVGCIDRLRIFDVDRVLECGPGRVLTGLNKRIDPNLQSLALDSLASFGDIVAILADNDG